jgi:glutamyl-tRNA reductase
MALFTLGINHRTAPLEVREQVAFHAEELRRALSDLMSSGHVHEAAILSTCNRTELYCQADTPQAAIDWLADYRRVRRMRSSPTSTPSGTRCRAPCLSCRQRPRFDGARRTADSRPDEGGRAHRREAGTLGTTLNKLFQNSFAVAKEVRSTTAIGANIVSMAAAAVRLAERIFERISPISAVLFIGAGEMIELCARISRRKAEADRHRQPHDRSRPFAGRSFWRNGDPPRRRRRASGEFDIVVSCTASQLPIIGLGLVERAIKARRHRPMFMVDLAVPRDVEPRSASWTTSFSTPSTIWRRSSSRASSRGRRRCRRRSDRRERVDSFLHWLQTRETVPVIRSLRDSRRAHAAARDGARAEAAGQGRRPGERARSALAAPDQQVPARADAGADPGRRPQMTCRRVVTRLFNLHPRRLSDFD